MLKQNQNVRALALYKKLLESAATQNEQARRFETEFRAACEKRWGVGLDKISFFIELAERLVREHHARFILTEEAKSSFRNSSIINLFARALRTAREIETLLRNGFSDGALARWRTLHELSIIALFIKQSDEETALRYQEHDAFELISEARDMFGSRNSANLSAGEMEILIKAINEEQRLFKKYGKDFRKAFGWAAINFKKKEVKPTDLESAAGLTDFAPHYRAANRQIHASVSSRSRLLGNLESETRGHLTGPSLSGLRTPAAALAVSLSNVALALIDDYLTADELDLRKAIFYGRDDILTTFETLEAHTSVKPEWRKFVENLVRPI